jgi:hypothetical protein
MAHIQVTIVIGNDSGNVDLEHETGLTEGGFAALHDVLGGIDGYEGIYDGPTLVEGV